MASAQFAWGAYKNLTITMTYDTATLFVTGVAVTNNTGADVVFTLRDPATGVTRSNTVAATGHKLSFVIPSGYVQMTPDLDNPGQFTLGFDTQVSGVFT